MHLKWLYPDVPLHWPPRVYTPVPSVLSSGFRPLCSTSLKIPESVLWLVNVHRWTIAVRQSPVLATVQGVVVWVSVGWHRSAPRRGAADAEIKVPSGENTELKRSPFRAWSRSVYSLTCEAYCQGFLPCLFLPFRSIHLHFSRNLSRFLLCWLWLTHDSCVGPQNKIGHPAGCRFPFWVPAEYK